jgi:ribonuclease T1
MRLKLPLLLLLVAVAALVTQWTPESFGPGQQTDMLPPEAIETLQLIRLGGPFPHRQDGSTFQNRERLLPPRLPSYYREYTVRTPGARDRGARRIVTGGNPPEVFYYTDDHYRSFREIQGLP